METGTEGGEIMTGRELALYILANGYDDIPLVTYIDGNPVPVFDVCYEVGRKELVVLPDTRTACRIDYEIDYLSMTQNAAKHHNLT